jgi:hypothetical protein
VFDGLPERLHDLQRVMSEVSEGVSSRFFADSNAVIWRPEESLA